MKTTLAVCFMLLTSAAIAQSERSIPANLISKGVHRLQLKESFFVPARVVTGDVLRSTKSVNYVSLWNSREVYGTVKMTGTPSHVISKGVARMQYEKRK